MSRIPSKAMPHAYVHENSDDHQGKSGSGTETAGGDKDEGSSLTQRAGDIAKAVSGNRAAQVAAGVVVAGVVAAAATKIVRARSEDADGEGKTGTAKATRKKPAKKD